MNTLNGLVQTLYETGLSMVNHQAVTLSSLIQQGFRSVCRFLAVPTEYALITLLIAIALNGFVFQELFTELFSGRLALQGLQVPLYHVLLTGLSGWLGYLVLFRLLGGRFPYIAYLLVVTPLALFLIADRIHYNLFLAHLDGDALELAWGAMDGG